MRRVIWTAGDFLEQDFSRSWIQYPLLMRGGHMLLHGKRNIGKTALIMSWLISLLNGGKLFGKYRSQECKVVLVEADMPDVMLQDRLVMANKEYDLDGLVVCAPPVLNLMRLESGQYEYDEEVYDVMQKHDPDVIIWDTLRKVQPLEENDNAVPAQVYGRARLMFPGTAHVWLHHDKKTIPDQMMLDNEELFSGAGAWIDNADTAVHLVESTVGRCSLIFTKVRGGKPQSPISVTLDPDLLMFYRTMPRTVELANQQLREHPDWDEQDLAWWFAVGMIYPPEQARRVAGKYFEARRDPNVDLLGQGKLELE